MAARLDSRCQFYRCFNQSCVGPQGENFNDRLAIAGALLLGGHEAARAATQRCVDLGQLPASWVFSPEVKWIGSTVINRASILVRPISSL